MFGSVGGVVVCWVVFLVVLGEAGVGSIMDVDVGDGEDVVVVGEGGEGIECFDFEGVEDYEAAGGGEEAVL